MRLAYYSPLNPTPSGISDYSEELLPLLGREFEITLIADHPGSAHAPLAQFPLLGVEEFKKHPREWGVVLYHMGNSPAHAQIYRTLLEIPGVVALHDVVLHHLRAWQTLDRGDARGYIQAMREEYGAAGAELARLEALGLARLDRFAYPLNGAVVRAARALVVHSEYAARQIQSLHPAAPVAVIPMGIAPLPHFSTTEARARLGLPREALIVAAFGELDPHKRVTVALEAFARLRADRPAALLLLVGRESPNYDIQAVLARLGMQEAVRRVGFAPRDEYANYIAAADVCLNLRYPSAGETSASLLRLFAAGKAVIVTRTGAYAELPEAVCAKIEADEYEQDLLYAHLRFFAERPEARAALGAAAQDYVAQCHTLEQSAAAYADWLRAVVGGRAESRSYLKAWHPGGAATLGAYSFSDTPSPLALPSLRSSPSVPRDLRETHALPKGERGKGDEFLESVARAYAGLGLAPDDPTLQAVAAAIVELGLSGEEPGG